MSQETGGGFFERIVEACVEVGRPIIFGVGIIMIVYLPILTLEGVEGKLFRPRAITVLCPPRIAASHVYCDSGTYLAPVTRQIVREGEFLHSQGEGVV
jgi:Cu/Ag efflux pump CusA